MSRPLKRDKVKLNDRITLSYQDCPKPKGRHVTAWYAEPGRIVLVGEFKSWQVNKYVAGKNTTYMARNSWVGGEDTLHGALLWTIGRTFEEWKRALRDREIAVTSS